MSGNDKMTDEGNQGRGTGAAEMTVVSPGGPETALGGDIQAKIGQHLRAMYDDVVRQGVPDRFLDLLSQLDKPKKSDGGTPDSGGGT